MRGVRSVLVAVAVSLAVAHAGVAAPAPGPTNLGFETGKTDGWTINEPLNAAVVGTHTAESGTYAPASGSFMLVLSAGCLTETARQTMHLKAGRTISGWAAFDAHDSLPYNDGASVQIVDTLQNVLATPWSSDVADVGANGDGPWTSWSFTAPAEADYTLVLSSTNGLDCSFASQGLFDAPGTTLSAGALVPAAGLTAHLVDDNGAPLAGKTIHFTCGACAEATAVTDAAGVAAIGAAADPVLFAQATASGGYCAEFYGDAAANGDSDCAALI